MKGRVVQPIASNIIKNQSRLLMLKKVAVCGSSMKMKIEMHAQHPIIS